MSWAWPTEILLFFWSLNGSDSIIIQYIYLFIYLFVLSENVRIERELISLALIPLYEGGKKQLRPKEEKRQHAKNHKASEEKSQERNPIQLIPDLVVLALYDTALTWSLTASNS